MFAKRAKRSSPQEPPSDDGSQTTQSGAQPRDASTERLERELDEQSSLAATLREALDAATFKIEVLEKSYAKQLADTREKLAATERRLADELKVLAALDGGHEDALRALADARAELQATAAERDQLRQRIARGELRRHDEVAPRIPSTTASKDSTDSGGTINQLIANISRPDQREPQMPAGQAHAPVAAADAPHEEMLAPDLVFTRNDRESDSER